MTLSIHAFTAVLFFGFAVSLAATPVHSQETKTDSPAAVATVDVFGEAKLVVPKVFKAVQPQSQIIEREFSAGDEDSGTARVTFMPAGGDVKANIDRWKGQFSGGDAEKQKTEEMTLGKWAVFVVDVNGKFQERMGGGPFFGGKVVEKEAYAMVGAILVHPQGRKYFVKMVGPEKVVQDHREAFVTMIKSLDD